MAHIASRPITAIALTSNNSASVGEGNVAEVPAKFSKCIRAWDTGETKKAV